MINQKETDIHHHQETEQDAASASLGFEVLHSIENHALEHDFATLAQAMKRTAMTAESTVTDLSQRFPHYR